MQLGQVHGGDQGEAVVSEQPPDVRKDEEATSLWQMGMRFLGYADEEDQTPVEDVKQQTPIR